MSIIVTHSVLLMLLKVENYTLFSFLFFSFIFFFFCGFLNLFLNFFLFFNHVSNSLNCENYSRPFTSFLLRKGNNWPYVKQEYAPVWGRA